MTTDLDNICNEPLTIKDLKNEERLRNYYNKRIRYYGQCIFNVELGKNIPEIMKDVLTWYNNFEKYLQRMKNLNEISDNFMLKSREVA